MQGNQTDTRDDKRAAETENQRFTAGFDQFDYIGIQTDCRHCHDNHKLAHFFKRNKNRFADTESLTNRGQQ